MINFIPPGETIRDYIPVILEPGECLPDISIEYIWDIVEQLNEFPDRVRINYFFTGDDPKNQIRKPVWSLVYRIYQDFNFEIEIVDYNTVTNEYSFYIGGSKVFKGSQNEIVERVNYIIRIFVEKLKT